MLTYRQELGTRQVSVERHPILLYDGVCGLCNRAVQFVLKRDAEGIFLFAALQSAFAQRVLSRHQVNLSELDTFYVVHDFDPAQPVDVQQHESLLARSEALVFVLGQVGGVWRWAGNLFRIVPGSLRDWLYDFVARRRYRIFGKYDSCPLPGAETRRRFLDIG